MPELKCRDCGAVPPDYPGEVCEYCGGRLAALPVAKPVVTARRLSDGEAFEAFWTDLYRRRPWAYATYILVAVNVIVSAAMVLWGADPTKPNGEALMRWGASFGPATLGGEWWRLGTSAFVHSGAAHLLSNVIVVYYLGRTVERMIGGFAFTCACTSSALSGTILYVAWSPRESYVGESPVLYCMYGILLSLIAFNIWAFPKLVLRHHLPVWVVLILLTVPSNLFGTNVAVSSHLGGLISGLWFGCVLGAFGAPRASPKAWHTLIPAVAAAVGLIAAAATARMLHADVAGLPFYFNNAGGITLSPVRNGCLVPAGDVDVAFPDDALRPQAEAVGRYFTPQWAAFPGRKSCNVVRTATGFAFQIIAPAETNPHPDVNLQAGLWAAELSHEVFGGADVDLVMCDGQFTPWNTVPKPDRMKYRAGSGRCRVYCETPELTGAASRLAEFFDAETLPPGTQTTVVVYEVRGKIAVGFPFVMPVAEQMAFWAWYPKMKARAAAGPLAGRAFEMHMCDAFFRTMSIIGI